MGYRFVTVESNGVNAFSLTRPSLMMFCQPVERFDFLETFTSTGFLKEDLEKSV